MSNSIQGLGSMQGLQGMMGSMMQPPQLTDEQKTKIQDILSEYDPDNINETQAKEIFQKFKDAGIMPSKGMKEAIEDAGFDAEELRNLGMPEGEGQMPPPPPPANSSNTSGINTKALQSLMDILSQYDLSNITSDQQTDMLKKLKSAGLLQAGNTVNLSI